jgi:16S rRNA (guanine527-N7)-methyltransferase
MDIPKHFFPELSPQIISQLQHFCELVRAKNRALNLISRKDIDRIVEAHLLPSLAIFKKNPFEADATVLDIGTGGGFPGLPLAIAMPHVRFTLLDSIGKKIRAIREFVATLELKNITCVNDRVENLRGKYRYIVGRSVTNIDAFRALAEPHIQTPGKILYLTGGEIPLEKNMTVSDLFDLYEHQFCATKKLLTIVVGK